MSYLHRHVVGPLVATVKGNDVDQPRGISGHNQTAVNMWAHVDVIVRNHWFSTITTVGC